MPSPVASLPFTEYVRSLDPHDASAGGGFEAAHAAAWRALCRALAVELKKRGLWEAPPSYLGIYGAPCWWGTDALDELASECYLFVFCRRLTSLRRQLERKGNIEGLVRLGVRHFVHDTQKKHDPLGFQVYVRLRQTVGAAIGRGTLRMLAGGPPLRNDTLLGSSASPVEPVAPERMAEIVAEWSDDLLPELVTTRGRRLERVQTRLGRRLDRLPARGIDAFCFRDLLAPLRREARRRWRLLALDAAGFEVGGAAPATSATQPGRALEERAAVEELFARLSAAIGELDEGERTKSYLWKLLRFLGRYLAEDRDAWPSDRRLSRLLELPRGRIPGLLDLLGGLVEDGGPTELRRAC